MRMTVPERQQSKTNSAVSLGAPVIVFEISHLVVYLGLGVTHRVDSSSTETTDPVTDPTV